MAVLLVVAVLPFVRTVPARSQAPSAGPFDLGIDSWVVGIAATEGRVIVATGTEVIVASSLGVVLVRRSLPGFRYGMALSPDGSSIYVGRHSPRGIDRLDSTTLATTASVTFDDEFTCLGEPVPAGGRVWFVGTCGLPTLTSIDAELATQPQKATAAPNAVAVAASADGARLYAVMRPPAYGTQVALAVLDPTQPAGVVVASRPYPSRSAGPMAVSPDGRSLVVGGEPARVVDTATLEPRLTLHAHDSVDKVLVTGDGRHVVGMSLRRRASDEDNVLWWSIDHPGQIGSALPGMASGQPVMAVSPDGRAAYVIGSNQPLHVVPIGPDPARLDIALDPGPASGTARVHGTLGFTDGTSPGGRRVDVVRATPFAPPVPLTATTAPDGRFEVLDLAPPGPVTYRVGWAGDAQHDAALAMASSGAAAPTGAGGRGLPDRAVEIDTSAHILLLDEVHGRLFLGGDRTTSPTTLTVKDLEGASTGTVALPAAPLDLSLSPTGTEIFVVLAGGGIAVLDGFTLAPAGLLRPGPLVPRPEGAAPIGGRLWVAGSGRSPAVPDPRLLVAVDLARPVDAVPRTLGHTSGYDGGVPIADPADPNGIYDADAFELARLNLATEPPTTTGAVGLSSMAVAAAVAPSVHGPLFTGSGHLLRDHDPTTLAVRRSRYAESWINGLAAGPSAGLVASSSGLFTAPDQGRVLVWGAPETPLRRYHYDNRTVDDIVSTSDGTRVIAVSRHAGSAVGRLPPTMLHVLHDAYGPCRVVADALAPVLTAGGPATLFGTVTTGGGAPQSGTAVTITVGSVSVTVQSGKDGRFSTSLDPTVTGAVVASLSVAGDVGCTATVPVTVGPRPDGPPSAPATVTASPSRDAAIVRWTVPPSDGGSPVTGYEVRATVGDRTVTVAATAGQREAVLAPLPAGTAVQATVRARNIHGWSPTTASTAVTPAAWWPFQGPQAVVGQHYRDILFRSPTAAEVAAWVTALTNGSASVASMADALYRSAEATNGPLAAAQLWIAGAHEFPDRSTLETWATRLRSGTTISTLGRAVAARPGFTSRYGALSNRAFVDALARDLLGAPLPATAAAQWAALLGPGMLQRGDLLAFFGLQPQARSRWVVFPVTHVVLTGQLGALPPFEVLAATINELAAGQVSLTGLVDRLTRDPAYGARFGIG